MPKFFVEDNQITNEVVNIIGEDVNHITNVLRLQKQDKLYVCNKDKEITYQTEIIEIEKQKVICHIMETIEETVESNIHVTIFQGLPKSDKMEYIIQKSTEIGVKTIVPVAMNRCIAKLEGKDAIKKIDRWNKIAEVAAKQSGRDMIPEVKTVMKFKDIKNIIRDFDLFLVAYEEEKKLTLKQVLQEKVKEFGTLDNQNDLSFHIGIVIGPEGGMERDEIEELREYGAQIITLGNRILRTETASLVILSNIMYELTD